MKIGETLYIDIEYEQNKIEKYRCKIIDKNEKYLFIDYPIHDHTHKTFFIPNETDFYVTYRQEENVYQFRSYVVKRVRATIPSLAIHLPPKTEHKRVQRRKHVRVETAIDLAVHCQHNSFSPFTTVTYDISGGGLSIYVEEEVFNRKIPVQLSLVLPMNSEVIHYIFTEAEFIRYKQYNINGIKTASLKFTTLSSKDQQKIIMYCFEKEREVRKKESMIRNK